MNKKYINNICLSALLIGFWGLSACSNKESQGRSNISNETNDKSSQVSEYDVNTGELRVVEDNVSSSGAGNPQMTTEGSNGGENNSIQELRLVFENFKKNFPNSSNFNIYPIITKIKPNANLEIFEITTPNGIFYTDKSATWVLEGVLLMKDPNLTEGDIENFTAAGMVAPFANITMREDIQERYSMLRDKETAFVVANPEGISAVNVFNNLPRDKAISLTYGKPEHEVVLFVDSLDKLAHKFFNDLSMVSEDKVNIKFTIFPVGMDEIRPESNLVTSAIMCAGFNPEKQNSNSQEVISNTWKRFMEDKETLDNPLESWERWAEANDVSLIFLEDCPRANDPGVFSRLATSIGVFQFPFALLSNGKALIGDFDLEKIKEQVNKE